MTRSINIVLAVIFMAASLYLCACSSLKPPPLLTAIDEGHPEQADNLLSTGADPQMENAHGVTPLFAASAKGYDKLVQRLIDNKADVNAAVKKTFKQKTQTIYKGTTPLMAALNNDNFGIAELLISNGAKVNYSDENGLSPLFISATKKNKQMMKTLIDKGAKVNNATSSPFVYNGETVCSGFTPLMAAIANNRRDNALMLIDHGADIKAKCKNGEDALIVATINGDADMVETLLQKGADPKSKTTQDFIIKADPALAGADALIAAADKGSNTIVADLIKAGADVNSTSKIGFTALMAASAKNHLDVVQTLVLKGAKVNAKTTEKLVLGLEVIPKGSSVLSIAAWNGHAPIVEFLIKNGANVNGKSDEYNLDPLFMAAEKGHYDAAKILIDNGADVFAVSDHGTALNAAKHYGYKLIADLITKTREEAMKEKAKLKEKE